MITGNRFLDWAILTVSLVNIILMGWLGLTILLNSRRRDWGVWLIGCGMLAGTLFFVLHVAIVVMGFRIPIHTLNIWWQLGWLFLLSLPFTWYITILWYVGFWENRTARLARRQRLWFWGATLLSATLALLVLVPRMLPRFDTSAVLHAQGVPTTFGIPLLFLLFPISIALNIGLSIDALHHPVPSPKLLGDQARRLAQPWLVGASWVLFSVTLVVGAVIGWKVSTESTEAILASIAQLTEPGVAQTIGWLDLVLSLLICAAAVLIGQAIVHYEIFTGKALPRGELRRDWFNVLILAVGFGSVVSSSWASQQPPVYSILLAALLITAFYALLNWRAYGHRDAYLNQLRPWVRSQSIHEGVLTSRDPQVAFAERSVIDQVHYQFRQLCIELLNARFAYLSAAGSLTSFVRQPLTYPLNEAPQPTELASWTQRFQKPDGLLNSTEPTTLQPEASGGYQWVVPLWSERGLIGLFLLGPKADGGLYTQEEMEIAQATGERLIDTLATAEITQSLLLLQRNRLVESHLVDQQTRRVLHDDVLPKLHSLLIELSGYDFTAAGASISSPTQSSPVNSGPTDSGPTDSGPTDSGPTDSGPFNAAPTDVIADLHSQISDLLRNMPIQAAPHIGQLGLIGALESMLAQEMANSFDAVHWQIEPDAPSIDKQLRNSGLPKSTLEVIYYAAREAMRNAARHGRGGEPDRQLELTVNVTVANHIRLTISDDGVGLRHATSANSGSTNSGSTSSAANSSSTTSSGAGQGLSLHSTMLAVLGGSLEISSEANVATQVRIIVGLPGLSHDV